jgi:hypothetical protein
VYVCFHEQWHAAQELELDEEPLSLEGFLALERKLPDASDSQHIANKLLYDATNEALIDVYRAANRIKARMPQAQAVTA